MSFLSSPVFTEADAAAEQWFSPSGSSAAVPAEKSTVSLVEGHTVTISNDEFDSPIPSIATADESSESESSDDGEQEQGRRPNLNALYPQEACREESPDLIRSSIASLEAELHNLPTEETQGWLSAKEKCPRLVNNDKHKLLFLRSEKFRPNHAARRLTRYWSKRIEVFGPDRAFLPLTLDGALKDDFVALSTGFMVDTNMSDSEGRKILYCDPSRQADTYERTSMVRALWYTVHGALEDEMAQKHGIVLMINHRNVTMSQFDPQLVKLKAESLRGCIPMRIGAFHLLHLPEFVHTIRPVMEYLLGERLFARIVTHEGTDEDILRRLEDTYGIAREAVPRELGGNFIVNQQYWLVDRMTAGL